jgi:hypothetical protein
MRRITDGLLARAPERDPDFSKVDARGTAASGEGCGAARKGSFQREADFQLPRQVS